jgi:hypothetical protein
MVHKMAAHKFQCVDLCFAKIVSMFLFVTWILGCTAPHGSLSPELEVIFFSGPFPRPPLAPSPLPVPGPYPATVAPVMAPAHALPVFATQKFASNSLFCELRQHACQLLSAAHVKLEIGLQPLPLCVDLLPLSCFTKQQTGQLHVYISPDAPLVVASEGLLTASPTDVVMDSGHTAEATTSLLLHPSLILTQNHFELFFLMLEAPSSLADCAWKLIVQLPTNRDMLQALHELAADANGQPSGWLTRLDIENPRQLVYMLQILDAITSQLGADVGSLQAWWQRFATQGGLNVLVKRWHGATTPTTPFESWAHHSDAVMLLSRLLQTAVSAVSVTDWVQPTLVHALQLVVSLASAAHTEALGLLDLRFSVTRSLAQLIGMVLTHGSTASAISELMVQTHLDSWLRQVLWETPHGPIASVVSETLWFWCRNWADQSPLVWQSVLSTADQHALTASIVDPSLSQVDIHNISICNVKVVRAYDSETHNLETVFFLRYRCPPQYRCQCAC